MARVKRFIRGNQLLRKQQDKTVVAKKMYVMPEVYLVRL